MRRHALAFLFLPVAVVLAACAAPAAEAVASADGAGPTAAETVSDDGPAPADDLYERGLQFAQCMRDHGVDMPDPDPDGGLRLLQRAGDDPGALEDAQRACERYAPGSGGERPELSPEQLEQMRAFAACMRENGVPDFPDPGSDGGIRIERHEGSGSGGVGLDEEAFEAADEICGDLRPQLERAGP